MHDDLRKGLSAFTLWYGIGLTALCVDIILIEQVLRVRTGCTRGRERNTRYDGDPKISARLSKAGDGLCPRPLD